MRAVEAKHARKAKFTADEGAEAQTLPLLARAEENIWPEIDW